MKYKNKLHFLYVGSIIISLVVLNLFMFIDNGNNENETSSNFPKIYNDNKINENYSSDVEGYVSQNFGFRNELLQVDTTIKDVLFKTSSLDTVVTGKNGYLYYGDTTNDYLGIVTLNDRELYNIQHTLELMQEYVENNNGEFLFMVAPNKNSLYDYMPNQYIKFSKTTNKEMLFNNLGNVNHLDLFKIFNDQNKELYYKTDSHWNNEGALLVYQTALETLNKQSIDFSKYQKESIVVKGDLYHMLYPSKPKNEATIKYQKDKEFEYITKTRSNEQTYIETTCNKAEGSLLMFRDSFSNNLIDYFSESYKYAIYDKASPYNLLQINKYNSDTVILEIAERNISLIQEAQPIFMAPIRKLDVNNAKKETVIKQFESTIDKDYIHFRGSINPKIIDTNSKIYLEIDNNMYEMTPQKTNDSEWGFSGYVDISKYDSLNIYIESNSALYTECIK